MLTTSINNKSVHSDGPGNAEVVGTYDVISNYMTCSIIDSFGDIYFIYIFVYTYCVGIIV